MGMGLSYEECRRIRVEENKKRLEDLNLFHLAQNLSPKSTPMKRMGKPQTVEKRMVTVAVRRSPRIANSPVSAPVYLQVHSNRITSPRKSYGVPRMRDLSIRVYITDEARLSTFEKAEKIEAKIKGEGYPILVRSMLPSHVSGGFWLGLPADFCRTSLPRTDTLVTLVDEQGDEYPTVYLASKRGLSGGWKGFAVAHGLVYGDAVVFQVISHSVLKVYIIRANSNVAELD